MPKYTTHYNLYEYDTSTDGNLTFNIDNALNNNFDTIDTTLYNLAGVIPSQTGNSGKFLTTNGTAVSWGSLPSCLLSDGSNLATTTGQTGVRAVTESYVNGKNGYIIYSDGLIEQWGYATSSSTTAVNLLKSFTNTNYAVIATPCDNAAFGYISINPSMTPSTSSFYLAQSSLGTEMNTYCYWIAIGY